MSNALNFSYSPDREMNPVDFSRFYESREQNEAFPQTSIMTEQAYVPNPLTEEITRYRPKDH